MLIPIIKILPFQLQHGSIEMPWKLLGTEVTIITNDICKLYYGIRETNVCANHTDEHCMASSGSPLVYNNTLIALHSFVSSLMLNHFTIY